MSYAKMDSTYIFTDRAQEYARYRSTYPIEAIAAIVEGLVSSSQLVAADIRAGTTYKTVNDE